MADHKSIVIQTAAFSEARAARIESASAAYLGDRQAQVATVRRADVSAVGSVDSNWPRPD